MWRDPDDTPSPEPLAFEGAEAEAVAPTVEGPMDDQLLIGTVAQQVYRNPDGRFSVVRVETADQGVVTVTGALPEVHEGEVLRVDGVWALDRRYGRQFKARHAQVAPPTSKQAIQRYLAAGAVQGIGPELARRIVEAFGEDTVRVLDETPEDLAKVKGIGKKRLKTILDSWEDQRSNRETMLFLRGHGLGPVLAGKVQQAFGGDARRCIEDDPYRIAREIDGAGFLTADRLATSLGVAADDPRRLRAGLLHVVQELVDAGNTGVRVEDLLELASQRLDHPPREGLDEALFQARQLQELELDRVWGEELVFLPTLLRAERGAAQRTVALALAQDDSRLPEIDPERALGELEDAGIVPSEQQAEAIAAALTARLTVITGGPGVGKTTVVRALVQVLTTYGAHVALAAPTGRAAKRLEEATGHRAATLHRLLEWDPRQGFGRNTDATLDCDLLVVDEASMIDIRLYHSLIRALSPGTHLVLIGDVDQLPSVGPGTVLADLLKTEAAHVVRLTEVFRQAAASRIVAAAHAIHAGHLPPLDHPDGSDFFFIARNDPESALDAIVRLVTERIPQAFHLDPVRDVQVLAPMRRGRCGTDKLNEALKAALTPNPSAGKTLDPGDKVMQLKNDYDREVFNGDVGRVLSRDAEGTLQIDFDGRQVSYPSSETSRLALAYCATIHKAQGSEYPVVILPVLTEHWVMLERNLVYTGLTRGKQLAILVGQLQALDRAVHNDRPNQRLSLLAPRITQGLAGPPPELDAE